MRPRRETNKGAARFHRPVDGAPIIGTARELFIASMGARGDGVAEDLYVPLSLPGERVLARAADGRAEIVEIIVPSPDRAVPPCPYFGKCGGCALQHWATEPYLAWKSDQIRQALARVRIDTEILQPFAAREGARRRVALHARRQNGSVVLGFKARRSWRVTPIGSCLIADACLNAALPDLVRLAEPFLEHPKSAPTLHVTATLTGLDVDVTGVERRSGGLSVDARQRAADAAGQGDMARVTMSGEVIYQARQPQVRVGPAIVALPPGAFLQAVAAAEEAMVAFAVEAASGARRIADLFCGVGAFTFPLAGLAPVMAADVSAPAIDAVARASGTVSGLKPITAITRDLDRRPLAARDLAGMDVVLIDPPRAGAINQCRELANSKCAAVIGVSCDPTSFARDARILTDGGFVLKRVLPVDQFLWSPHIELVGLFSRAGP